MKILIIAAHGSRKKESAREVGALAAKVAEKAGTAFDRVVHGFLQFSEPLLPGVIDDAVVGGACDIVVFPFFISAGSHILSDIPELVADAGRRYPDVKFTIARHLGAVDGVEELILGEVGRG